jgi:hypothetical protein
VEVDDEIKNTEYEKQVDEYPNVKDWEKSNDAVNDKSIWNFLLYLGLNSKIYPLCICNCVSLESLSGQFLKCNIWADHFLC